MIKFKDFNKLINPENSLVYIPLQNKTPINGLIPHSFDSMKRLGEANDKLEIGLLVPKGVIVINIDDRDDADKVLEIIEDRQEKVMCVKTPKGMHIYAISGINTNTKNNILALGIRAGTISQDIGKSYVVLPFKSPRNKNPRVQEMEVVYFNGIDTLPFWLTPIHSSDSKTVKTPTFTYPIEDEHRTNAFIGQLNMMKFSNMSGSARADTIKIINWYLTKNALNDKEIDEEIISEYNDDQIADSLFFDGNTFLHWKLGDYMIEHVHAIINRASGVMYYYNERTKTYSDNHNYLKGVITSMIPGLTDNRKNEVIKHMESKLSLNPVALDEDKYLVNCKNGVLDVETMKLYPHSPSFYGTIQINTEFNPEATSDVADEFFRTVTQGDKQVEQLLYEAIGYSLLKTVELDKVFILTGEGRNGKSTYLDLIREIVGIENASSLDFKELNSAFGTSGLAGKLVSLAGDISNKMLEDSDVFKKIASGDLIRVNEKYKAKYETVPFTTLFFSANDIPMSKDTTFAFYRRLSIIPFHANLKKITMVEGKTFKSKLLSNQSRQYVLAKSIKAINRVLHQTQEFIVPDVVKLELEKYRIKNSSTLQWARDMKMTQDKLSNESGHAMFERYRTWCDINGRRSKGYNNFIEELSVEYEIAYSTDTGRFDKKK